MGEEKGLWAKVGRLDRRIMLWMLVISLFYFAINPILLPIPLSDATRKTYELIDGTKSGDLVMFALDFTAGAYSSVGASAKAMLIHLTSRGAKMVFMSSAMPEASAMFSLISKGTTIGDGYKYGIDYVNLGFIPGGESTVNAIAKNFQANVKADIYGTPIEKIPLMQKIRGAADFKLVIEVSSGTYFQWWATHWNTAYGVPVVVNCTGATVGSILPFYGKGVTAYTTDVVGGAEYEYIIRKPGEATRIIGMQNVTHIWLWFWLALGNIALVTERLRSRAKEGNR